MTTYPHDHIPMWPHIHVKKDFVQSQVTFLLTPLFNDLTRFLWDLFGLARTVWPLPLGQPTKCRLPILSLKALVPTHSLALPKGNLIAKSRKCSHIWNTWYSNTHPSPCELSPAHLISEVKKVARLCPASCEVALQESSAFIQEIDLFAELTKNYLFTNYM